MISSSRGSRQGRRHRQQSTNGTSVSRRVMVPSRSNTARAPPVASCGTALTRELAQHVLQYPAVLEIFALLRSIDAYTRLKAHRTARGRRRHHRGCNRIGTIEAGYFEALLAGQP